VAGLIVTVSPTCNLWSIGILRFDRIDTNLALLVININESQPRAGACPGAALPLDVLFIFIVGAGKPASFGKPVPRRNHFPNSLSVAVMRPMVGFTAQYSFSLFKLSINVLVSIIGGSCSSL
jgi:hypothetical protein